MMNKWQPLFKPKEYILVIYYIVMVIVLLSWTSQETAPSLPLRMAFLTMILLPGLKHPWVVPPVMTVFLTLSTMGFSYSYLPSSLALIFVAVAIVYFFTLSNKLIKNRASTPLFLIVLILLVSLIDSSKGFQLEQITFCLLLIILFSRFLDLDLKSAPNLLRLSIVFSCVSLCIMYFLFGDMFTTDYGGNSGLERVGWADANYFGTTIGSAAICVLHTILYDKSESKLNKAIYLVCLFLILIVMLSVASRGASLALIVCVAAMFITNRVKIQDKIFIGFIILVVVYFLYRNGYFELLLYRIAMDEMGGGSGRFDIWVHKFNAFSTECGTLEWLFGIGFRNAMYLGYNKSSYLCVHNDMLAFLFSYGLLGLFLYFALLVMPIRNAFKYNSNKSNVLIGVIYIFVCGLTLQPLCEGFVVYYCFYFYLWYLSLSNASQLSFAKHFIFSSIKHRNTL